jgi:drug/metabolite transporter (DMT)-like permease
LPFLLVVGCLRHLRATQAGIVGMTEPVIAAVVAYFVLGESLTPTQLIGGAVVLTAVVLAETSRSAVSA